MIWGGSESSGGGSRITARKMRPKRFCERLPNSFQKLRYYSKSFVIIMKLSFAVLIFPGISAIRRVEGAPGRSTRLIARFSRP